VNVNIADIPMPTEAERVEMRALDRKLDAFARNSKKVGGDQVFDPTLLPPGVMRAAMKSVPAQIGTALISSVPRCLSVACGYDGPGAVSNAIGVCQALQPITPHSDSRLRCDRQYDQDARACGRVQRVVAPLAFVAP
jgi:hypothetical protein